MRMVLVFYFTSLVMIIYIHMCTRIYIVLVIACMEAYHFLHIVTLGHALVILVVQICILSWIHTILHMHHAKHGHFILFYFEA